jgi:dienelactone hydrolase
MPAELRNTLVPYWQSFRSWWLRTWADLRPGPEARRGAVWAALATVIWAAVIGGIDLKTGFGVAVDLLVGFLIAAIGIPLVALLAALLFTIFRKLPRLLSGFFIGAFLFISLLWISLVGYAMALLLLLIECALGATIATLLFGDFRHAARSKQLITLSICIVAIAANVFLFTFFRRDGVSEQLIRIHQTASAAPPPLNAANPAQPGSYVVKKLFYGSGHDLRRPEYRTQVAIRTSSVDASPFFKDFKGWKANLRKRYWGFGMDKLPLNGRVWYPEGAGPFPLVLIVHGNHDMSEFSDPGYAYLGELMASRGFILASIDENFLNSGLFNDPPKQQAVRGWMLLEHLKIWRAWNNTKGNPFYKKIDVENVALMGHSRGGEAAATAALFNKLAYYPDDATIQFHYGFPIKSIVAIAPADGQYRPAGGWRILQNVNYFTIQGANDADVSSFMGSRQWDHVVFQPHSDFFKAELYIYRANHGQFNTVWGRTDLGAPNNWFLNLHPLLKGDDQRRIAKIYISAFLESTLHNRREYVPLFEDYRRIRDWLPDTLYVNRYLDARNALVSDFSEDVDVTTTTAPGGHLQAQNLTVWREGRIPYRKGDRDYNGVFLGWNREHAKAKPEPPVATYAIDLPPNFAREWRLDADSALTLSIAVTDEKAPRFGKEPNDEDEEETSPPNKNKPEVTDFTVEVQTQDGLMARLPLSRFGALLPPLKVQFTKLQFLDSLEYKHASEPIFQTIELPLSAFAAQDHRFDPAKLKSIRLRFDRTPSRVLIISQIGFERPDRNLNGNYSSRNTVPEHAN